MTLQFLVLKTVAQAPPERANEYLCPYDLDKAIADIIQHPQLARSSWGISVQTLANGKTLYALNEDKYFIPASNLKLLTTAAALLELGKDFQITTPIYLTGKAPHLSSLSIKGKGDPTISSNDLRQIAQQLRQQGVKSIDRLVVDNSYFSLPQINPTWEWFDLYSYYATSVGSLILNQNKITLTVVPQQLGQPVKYQWSESISYRQWQINNQAITAPAQTPYSIEIEPVLGKSVLQIRGELALDAEPDIWDLAVVDPAHYFLESFRVALSTRGITVDRGLVESLLAAPSEEPKLLAIKSPPLSELIAEINRESNNLYAEALLQILAQSLPNNSPTQAIAKSLKDLGISPTDYNLVDGSGLSRQNLVAPETLVKILRSIRAKPEGNIFQQSLSLAGVKGTLAHRFRNTVIQGKLWGKTGTLTGVASLSGYLEVPAYQPLVFSIMIDNATQSSATLRQTIDEIVLLLGKLNFCR